METWKRGDNEIVRRYLRIIVGSPVLQSDDEAVLVEQFQRSGRRWAADNHVDRRTLAKMGVPDSVLDAARIPMETAADLIRHRYARTPFSAADLVDELDLSASTIRLTLRADEKEGLVRRAGKRSRTQLWQLRELS